MNPGVPLASVPISDVGTQRLAAGVDLEDLLPPRQVGPVDHDLPVETARPEERGVEDVGAVGGGEHDDAALGVEAVHLDEELVERLLPLVVPTAEAGATLPTDGVDLVHKDDAGRVLLGLLEEVAHAAGADADEHLDEVGARDGEERYSGLSGDGAGEQRLAGTRRSDEERALRYAGAELLELLGRFEELFDLRELLDGLVGPGDVGEGHLGLVLGHPARPALAEAHHPVTAALHGAHEQDEEQHDEQDGRQGTEQREPEAGVLRVDRVRYVLLVELGRHVGHLGVGVLELPVVSVAFRLQEPLDRLVFVVDGQVVLVGLGEIRDERFVLDGLVPLLGVQLVHVRVAPAQHVYQDDGQDYEDDEVKQPAASQNSAQKLLTFHEVRLGHENYTTYAPN